MFGLFKKKDSQPINQPNTKEIETETKSSTIEDVIDDDEAEEKAYENVQPSAKALPLVQRWEDLVTKIQDKATQILQEAETASEPLITNTKFDTQAITQAWTGIKTKVVHDLGQKTGDSWSKFLDLTSEAGLTRNDINLQKFGQRRDETVDWLEIEYERYYVKVFAKAAQKIWENALNENQVKDFSCSSCGAKLDLHKQIFHAINIKCNYCNFVNTYEPPDKMRMAEAFAVNPLCSQTAFDFWEKMIQAIRKVKNDNYRGRKVDMHILDEYENKALDYWTTWYKKREELITEYAKHTQGDIDSKMQWVWKDLKKYNNQWQSKYKPSIS